MIQYCSITMNSILSKSSAPGSSIKRRPGNMPKLSDTVTNISNKDSVGLMNTLVKWNHEEGRLASLHLTSYLTNSKTGKE